MPRRSKSTWMKHLICAVLSGSAWLTCSLTSSRGCFMLCSNRTSGWCCSWAVFSASSLDLCKPQHFAADAVGIWLSFLFTNEQAHRASLQFFVCCLLMLLCSLFCSSCL